MRLNGLAKVTLWGEKFKDTFISKRNREFISKGDGVWGKFKRFLGFASSQEVIKEYGDNQKRNKKSKST